MQASQACQKLLFTHQNHILWTNWGFSHSAATGECFQWHSNHVKTNKCRLCGLKSSGFALSGAEASLFIIKTAQKRVYLFCVKIWFKVGSQRARNTFSPFNPLLPFQTKTNSCFKQWHDVGHLIVLDKYGLSQRKKHMIGAHGCLLDFTGNSKNLLSPLLVLPSITQKHLGIPISHRGPVTCGSHLLYSYLEWTSQQINNYYYPIILLTIEFHKFLYWNQEYLFKATTCCCWAMRDEWLEIKFNTFPQLRRIQMIFKYTNSVTLYLFAYHLS